MQISSRFTVALHILSCMETFKTSAKITSAFLAGSVQVNPVTVRNILLQLKAAGIVCSKRGKGAVVLAKSLSEITFLDVYRAIEPLENGSLFHFHENPNPKCPVGKNIHQILDKRLFAVQNAMEQELQKMTVADIVAELESVVVS